MKNTELVANTSLNVSSVLSIGPRSETWVAMSMIIYAGSSSNASVLLQTELKQKEIFVPAKTGSRITGTIHGKDHLTSSISMYGSMMGVFYHGIN